MYSTSTLFRCSLSIQSNNPTSSQCVDSNNTTQITLSGVCTQGGQPYVGPVHIDIGAWKNANTDTNSDGSYRVTLDGTLSPGSYRVVLEIPWTTRNLVATTLTVKENCQPDDQSLPSLTIGPPMRIRPQECLEGEGIITALGCIPTKPQGFITWVFKFAAFIGGGIAFLLMGWGAFLMITSAGNPEQIQAGREIMISAGTGLLFIIFSVFILRLIGVDILKIPGFR